MRFLSGFVAKCMMACQLMTAQHLPTVGIVGAGAMGALFGAHLAEAGGDPILVDVDPAVVERIGADGVAVRRGADTRHVPVRATTDPTGEPPVDVLLLFVKCYATDAALRLAAPLIAGETLVLSLQNGWGNADRVAAFVPRDRVFAGVTYHSATLLSPGVVDHTAVGRTYLGPIAPEATSQAQRISSLLEAAGLEAAVDEEIVERIWGKLVLNASANPIAALTGLRAGALVEVPEVLSLIQDLAREVVAVGQAGGHDLDADHALADVHELLVKAGPATSSMRQDVEAGRQTEIDVMNGAVLRAAEASGIEVPLNRVVHSLIKGYEAGRART
jgi:2-dehydropantoate 2-reductase